METVDREEDVNLGIGEMIHMEDNSEENMIKVEIEAGPGEMIHEEDHSEENIRDLQHLENSLMKEDLHHQEDHFNVISWILILDVQSLKMKL